MDELEYLRPKDLAEALRAAESAKGMFKFVAGGTNVIPDMRAKTLAPRLLIDLSFLDDLRYVRDGEEFIAIGALTTISQILDSGVIRDRAPVLSAAAGRLGSPLTRNRATIGGNLADASPCADTALPLLVMDATVHTARPRGVRREIPIDRFFLGPNRTALAEDEIITELTFAKPKRTEKGSFIKLGLRNAMAIAVASVAVEFDLDGRSCRKARIALGSVAPTPMRARRTEKALEGKEIDAPLIRKCSSLVQEEILPISDIRGSAEYRKTVTAALFERAVQEVLSGGGA